MSKREKNTEELRMTPEMFDEFFGTPKDAIPPGHTVSWKLSEEHPDEVIKTVKKAEPRNIFELKPFYDVDKPHHNVSRPVKLHLPWNEPEKFKKVLSGFLDSKMKLKKGSGSIINEAALAIKHECDDLREEITRLIAEIDTLDKEAVEHFLFTYNQTLDHIEPNTDRYDGFKMDMYGLIIACRHHVIIAARKNKDELLAYDEMPQLARENLEGAVKLLFRKKQPLVDQLNQKIELYCIYHYALRRHKEGKRIIPKRKRGRKPDKNKDKVIRYYEENKERLRVENYSIDDGVIQKDIARQIKYELEIDKDPRTIHRWVFGT